MQVSIPITVYGSLHRCNKEIAIALRNDILNRVSLLDPYQGLKLYQNNSFQGCIDMLDPEFPSWDEYKDNIICVYEHALDMLGAIA
jgi:hypothetical protein